MPFSALGRLPQCGKLGKESDLSEARRAERVGRERVNVAAGRMRCPLPGEGSGEKHFNQEQRNTGMISPSLPLANLAILLNEFAISGFHIDPMSLAVVKPSPVKTVTGNHRQHGHLWRFLPGRAAHARSSSCACSSYGGQLDFSFPSAPNREDMLGRSHRVPSSSFRLVLFPDGLAGCSTGLADSYAGAAGGFSHLSEWFRLMAGTFNGLVKCSSHTGKCSSHVSEHSAGLLKCSSHLSECPAGLSESSSRMAEGWLQTGKSFSGLSEWFFGPGKSFSGPNKSFIGAVKAKNPLKNRKNHEFCPSVQFGWSKINT